MGYIKGMEYEVQDDDDDGQSVRKVWRHLSSVTITKHVVKI